MICIRSDIVQVMEAINRYIANPSGAHWKIVKRILKYIRGISNIAVYYRGLEFIIKGYMDSYFVGELDKKKYTYGSSCKLDFKIVNCSAFIYNRSRIYGSYTSL